MSDKLIPFVSASAESLSDTKVPSDTSPVTVNTINQTLCEYDQAEFAACQNIVVAFDDRTVTLYTKNQVLYSITKLYIDLVLTNPTIEQIDRIESDLLSSIRLSFQRHNDLCAKGEKWRIPDSLHFSQIAMILAHCFNVKRICCCPQNTDAEYDLLGVYVDDIFAHYTGLSYAIGTYVTSEDALNVLCAKFNFSLTIKDFNEIIAALRRTVPRVYRTLDKDLIPVANGIFNYQTKELLPFSSDYVFLVKCKVDYNPQATNVSLHNQSDNTDWDIESWMQELSDDPEIVQLLWEIIGAIIRPNVRWNKSAWLYSETGNNGKGTLCELMRSICGDTSYAAIPLSDFGKDFALEPLTRASAIIVDENDVGSFIDKAGNLKSVITNDVIQINRKFKTPIAYQFYGFMVQCLNEFPRIKDKSDSFYRRQLFIPMEKCFTGVERKYIKEDYLHRKDVLEYALKRVLEMNYYKLSEPESCKQVLFEYKEYNDPVRQFFDETKELYVWDLVPFTFLYDLFKSWFKQNNPSGTLIGKNTFVSNLITLAKNDDIWYADKNKQIRVSNTNFGQAEPLIAEYGLTAWMNSRYKGADRMKISTPDRVSSHYRGLMRIVPNNGASAPQTDTQDEES